VSEFFSAYCELISSPMQLAQCKQAKSVTNLLLIIKSLWKIPEIDDQQLLAELSRLNQNIMDDGSVTLAGHWLPYAYHAKSRSVYWCLADGHATEPFQDETISRYRQRIVLNQIIQPRTSLMSLADHASSVAVEPAGFIYHLSRCGSTLVSGCLSELDSTCVFSESPVLTDILLDNSLTPKQQQYYLQQFIHLQASIFPDRQKVIIKWNAWDIFRWHLIHSIYPNVPVVFLLRDPVEILASHQRATGRHMSGDLSMVSFHPVFSVSGEITSLLEFRIQVLQGLLSEMQKYSSSPEVRVVDYSLLDVETMAQIATHFNLNTNSSELIKIQERMSFHSKMPGKVFNPIGELPVFNYQEIESINKNLLVIYNQLSAALVNFKEASHVG
jgi:hypothetical protein